MRKPVFEDHCRALFNHFLAGPPSNFAEKVSGAYWHVKDVPDAAADWTVEQAIRTLDGMPRNLTKLFLEGWEKWQSLHPHLAAKRAAGGEGKACDECGGEGLIWFYERHNGRKYEVHGRCAKCENWRKHFNVADVAGPAVTLELLEATGRRLTPGQERILRCIRQRNEDPRASQDSRPSYSLRHVQAMSERIGRH